MKNFKSTIEKIKERFMVIYEYDNMNSETLTFAKKENAEKTYNKIADNILSETNALESRHWRNNKDGLTVELIELTKLSKESFQQLVEAENDEEFNELIIDIIFSYGDRIKSKITYLSDEWDETLGENGEFVIKEKEIEGAIYGTVPFSKNGITLNGNEVIINGVIE